MTWRIDPGVARELAALVGWSPDDDAAALTRAVGARIPTGTTAKLAAIAAGEIPPGADPEAIARRVVEDRTAGRPEPAWSCWAVSTLMAALVETLADRRADVAAIRRTDARSPAVDIHSLVVADGLLCDPYFATFVGGPGTADHERITGGVWNRRVDDPRGRWAYEVSNGRWGDTITYRVLAPDLDPDDVRIFCAVSASHSGAPTHELGFLWRPTDAVEAYAHHAGGAALRTWTWPPDDIRDCTVEVVEHPDWRAAADDFATRTGIALA